MVNEEAQPPVCRIMDYGKYRFEAEKRARESKRKTRMADLKEVKMSYKIGEHDYQVRVNQARSFMSSGDRVKAVVTLRGREIEHPTLGFDLLNRMAKDLGEFGDIQQSPKKEGRNITMIVIPKKTV
jgi:translation initiation factor IF-3